MNLPDVRAEAGVGAVRRHGWLPVLVSAVDLAARVALTAVVLTLIGGPRNVSELQ